LMMGTRSHLGAPIHALTKIECYNFRLCLSANPHRGRVAQLAEQLTLNQ
jgi:hypothetical protein